MQLFPSFKAQAGTRGNLKLWLLGAALVLTTSLLAAAPLARAATEIIVDNSDAEYADVGGWTTGAAGGVGYGDGQVRYKAAGDGSAAATWTPNVTTTGLYQVYVSWVTLPNRATNAPYAVNHANGSFSFSVNQQLLADQVTSGGAMQQWSGWYLAGAFSFTAGTSGSIVLNNDADNYVIADAVRLVYAELKVDDDGLECPDAPFTSIQDAIDAALSGDTVTVCAGIYEEQVMIDRDLYLLGAGTGLTTLNQPVSLAGDLNGSKNLMTVSGDIEVEIADFSLTGDGSGLDIGIYVRDGASANIHDNTISTIGSGGGNLGILVGRKYHSTTGTATITNNEISGYGKGGIVVDNVGSSATISGNTVTGSGSDPVVAQNGIQISRGATGTVDNNTITDHICTNVGAGCADDPTVSSTADGASGILLYVSGSPVEIANNTLTGNQFNIWTVGAEHAYIHDNDLTGASGTGIAVWDSDQWTTILGFTEMTTAALIENNSILNHDYGLLVRDYTAGGAVPAVEAHGNDMIGNALFGAWADIAIDAENNNWGDCTGPSGEGSGTGDAVSTNVDFDPWTGKDACPGTIKGRKYEDYNGDGIKDPGEPNLEGWTIVLMQDGEGVATTTTAANGLYEFTDLAPGTYTVHEVQQSGWVQTAPLPATFHTVNLGSGQTKSGRHFGNMRLTGVSGVKYEDLNGNGIRDIDPETQEYTEPGLQGWTIRLKQGGSTVASTVTDENGGYFLNAVNGPGEYQVRETLQTGWIQTSLPVVYTVNLAAGQLDEGIDFGNFKLVSIAGIKYHDHDGNGAQDPDDEALDNWRIYIDENADGSYTAGEPFVWTHDGGQYAFIDLGPGTYVIREVMKNGWGQSQPDPLYGSDEYVITPQSGDEVIGADFGNYQFAKIAGKKYQDLNCSGTRNANEPWLSGWEIKRYDLRTGTALTKVTNAQGRYVFNNLRPGNYIIVETLQSGWVPVNPQTGSRHVTVVSGETLNAQHFGNQTIVGYAACSLQGIFPLTSEETVPLESTALPPQSQSDSGEADALTTPADQQQFSPAEVSERPDDPIGFPTVVPAPPVMPFTPVTVPVVEAPAVPDISSLLDSARARMSRLRR